MKKTLDYQAFMKAVAAAKSIAITAPAGADGDSVGTQCSLKLLFEQQFPQKKVRIVNEEPCPARYKFLTGSEYFEVSIDLIAKNESAEFWICVDGGASRIGDDTKKLWDKAKLHGHVDHHAIGTEGHYDVRLYDPAAAATVEIVFGLLRDQKLKLTPQVAEAIYVGLIFDTGLFKHSNTKPSTMRIGAELLETGFNHTEAAEKAMLMRSLGGFKMLKKVLASATIESGGRYVYGILNNAAFKECQADGDDREGIIDQLFLVNGCQIAAFFFEKNVGDWKLSFRSRGWDVAALARSLNSEGGGHQLAAGCSLKGTEDEITAKAREAIVGLLEK
jgi:phosphoesterase RecJ-like protein